jgi:NADPH:quinone reductase-like Zn-dependent oxidoreductase
MLPPRHNSPPFDWKSLISGGKLLLLESIQPNFLMASTCFGLLPGWWRGEEPYRTFGPLLNEPKWDEVLVQSGFSGTDIVLRDTEDEAAHEISVFVSSAAGETSTDNAKKPVILICDTQQQLASQLVSSLQMQFVRNGYPSCSAVNYKTLLMQDLQDTLCVVLIGLGQTDLTALDKEAFYNIKHFLLSSTWLVWVSGDATENPTLGLATGLIRSVRWERDFDAADLTLLEIVNPLPDQIILANKLYDFCHRHFQETLTRSRNGEYLLKDGEIWSSRIRQYGLLTKYLEVKADKVEPTLQQIGTERVLRLTTLSPGLLDKLAFEPGFDMGAPPKEKEVDVQITVSSLNFRDVMIAAGQLNATNIGLEAAGIVTRVGTNVMDVKPGDRVLALSTASSAIATYCRVNEDSIVKIPQGMTEEDAASIPVPFITVLHSLRNVAKLSKGETILIHAAAGGTGQAAIQIAQLVGAEVFVTVSTIAKAECLIQQYELPRDHIFNSRDLSFIHGIQRMTHGHGVDVVLNSLAGEALQRSWDCLAPFGRFIEMGKRDIVSNGRLLMSSFAMNRIYYAVDTQSIAELTPNLATSLIQDSFLLYAKGQVHAPKPQVVFSFAEVEKAFRLLQSGSGMGKILLKPCSEDVVQVCH